MYCNDVMTPLLRHHPRCGCLGTSIGNIIIALMATLVASVGSARNYNNMRGPRPEFLQGLTNVTVREGGVAVLPCSVRHLGTKKVAWRRIEEDKFLTIGKMTWADDNHISVEYSRIQGQVSNWNLVIKHVSPTDDGIYECQITSRVGHVRHVQLNVVGPPISNPDSSLLTRVSSTHSLPDNIPHLPVIICGQADENGCLISITGRKFVDLGDKISLKCNASGGARVADEMDWFKEGDKIDSDKYSHVFIEKFKSMETRSFISILTIEHSSLRDTGDYICRSSRSEIASLKVTVLHAETENKRRGTENGRNQESYRPGSDNGRSEGSWSRDEGRGSYRVGERSREDRDNSSHHLSPSTSVVLCLMWVSVIVMHRNRVSMLINLVHS